MCHTTAATNRMRRHSLWMRTCTRGVMTGPMTTEKSPHCTPCHYLLPRTTTAGRARHQPVHPHIEDTTHNPQPVQVVADLSTNVCLPSRRKTHQDQDQFGVLLMKHVPNRKLGLRSTVAIAVLPFTEVGGRRRRLFPILILAQKAVPARGGLQNGAWRPRRRN